MPLEVVVALLVGVVSLILYLRRSVRLLGQGHRFRSLDSEVREELSRQDPSWERRYGRPLSGWQLFGVVALGLAGLALYVWAFAADWL